MSVEFTDRSLGLEAKIVVFRPDLLHWSVITGGFFPPVCENAEVHRSAAVRQADTSLKFFMLPTTSIIAGRLPVFIDLAA